MILMTLLSRLIPIAEYGFGRTDQPSGQTCSNVKHVEDLDTMHEPGSLFWARGVGARAKSLARVSTV